MPATRIVSKKISGLPIPQGQMIPRMTCRLRRGRQCKAWIAPPDKKAWKEWRELVTNELISELPPSYSPPKGEPYITRVTFYLPRPKSHYYKSGLVKSSAPEYHLVRPDLDNLVKAINDSITRAGVWADDSEVIECHLEKRFADGDPGVEIQVFSVGL